MERQRPRPALILLSAILLLAGLAACEGSPFSRETDQAQGGTLVYGLTLSPSSIDPHAGNSSELGIPLTSVYDTLVYQDLDGTFVPGLAKSWQVSDDGLVYTFNLRSDVQFHDSTPFNAEAVRFSLERIVDPNTKSRKAKGMLGPYDRTEILDEFTVAIHLQAPYAPLLDSLSQVYLGIASPAAVQEWGAEYPLHQVGTGPFIFQEYVPNDHITLVRNDDYAWAPEVYDHSGPAHLEEIVFRFYVDPAVRSLALESGEAGVMGELPPQDATRLEGDDGFALIPVSIPGQPLQFFLNTENPPADDLRVRQALIHATDRESIGDTVFQGFSPVAYGPLNAVTMDYDPAVDETYPYDTGRAEALLEEAGWIDSDGDGIRDRGGEPLSLQAYLMGWGYLPEVGQMLQNQLKAVGVDLQTQVVAFPAALEAAGKGEHHLAPMTFSGSDPSVLDFTYLSSNADGGFNWSKVRDPELDRILADAVGEMDDAQRTNLYSAAQGRIMDQALVLPVRDYLNLNAAQARVKGLRFDRRGWFPWLHDVYLED